MKSVLPESMLKSLCWPGEYEVFIAGLLEEGLSIVHCPGSSITEGSRAL